MSKAREAPPRGWWAAGLRTSRLQPPSWARPGGGGGGRGRGGPGACAEPGRTQTLGYAREVFTVRGAGLASRRLRPSEASPGPPRPRLLPEGPLRPTGSGVGAACNYRHCRQARP